MSLMRSATSKYAEISGLRTHYLEGGDGPPLILLHSGEFGACSELSWEYNFDGLAEHFHVLAPDWIGYGQSEKIFSFENMWEFRVNHIAAFVRHLGIERADFMGNSMGGTVLVNVASLNDGRWPINRMVLVSGGGDVPENEDRKVLIGYDGSEEWMRRIVQVLFKNPEIRDNEDYIRRRHKLSMERGAWECTAVARFKPPVRPPRPFVDRTPDYSQIRVPALIVAGRDDNLRNPGYGEELQKEIPGSELLLLDGGHCPQIDMPEVFNREVLRYLLHER